MENFIKEIEKTYIPDYSNKNIEFKTGDTITVNCEIKEGSKTRIQSFKGIVICCKGIGHTSTFTVRKISNSIGIERIFIKSQINIKNIEINKKGKVRRSKIYYFSNLKGKKARIKEKNK